MQKKVMRLICNSPYNAHSTPLFLKLHALKIDDLYDLQLAKFIFSLYNNSVPNPLQSFFSTNSETHKYMTRNSDNPVLKLHRTNVAARSIFSRSYKLWYQMDSDIKSSCSLQRFSKRYKNKVFQQYLENS